MDLDDIDRMILREVSQDAGLSAGELGRRLGLSQPAAWRRIKRLQEAGVIAGARVDADRAAGKPLPEWHYLVSGSRQTIHDAGMSVKGRAISELHAGPLENHIVEQPL